MSKHEETHGLVAIGSSGSWDIEVDDTLEGKRRWFLQFDGPLLFLYCQIAHPRKVSELHDFLQACIAGADCEREFDLSSQSGDRVVFLWDGETNDRCFVLVTGKGDLTARYKLDLDSISQIVAALADLNGELQNDGLLVDQPPRREAS